MDAPVPGLPGYHSPRSQPSKPSLAAVRTGCWHPASIQQDVEGCSSWPPQRLEDHLLAWKLVLVLGRGQQRGERDELPGVPSSLPGSPRGRCPGHLWPDSTPASLVPKSPVCRFPTSTYNTKYPQTHPKYVPKGEGSLSATSWRGKLTGKPHRSGCSFKKG